MIAISTLLIIILLHNNYVNCCKNQNNIIIIGAGSSGIAAASKLIKNGYTNLTILEAENRIGGRIYSTTFGNNIIDLGAEWCHGTRNNVVNDLASQYGLLQEVDIYDNLRYFQTNGIEMPQEIGTQQLNLLFNITEYNDEFKNFNGTIGDYVIPRYKVIADSFDLNETMTNEFLTFFELFMCIELALDNWHQETGIGYAAYQLSEGSQTLSWKGQGYKTILDILMQKYPNPSEDIQLEKMIHFNTTAMKIITEQNYIRVITTDDKEFVTDKVIVTVSLGVLKERYTEMFEPKLSILKQKAIQSLSIGTVDKLFLEFETQWWPSDNWKGIHVLWTKEELQNLNISNIWLSHLIGFYSDDYLPNILCGWISSAEELYNFENIDENQIKIQILDFLEKLINNKYRMSKLKNYVRTKWYSNPHFRGTWSYRGLSAQKFNVTNSDLGEPIKNVNGINVIYFAGEATHNTQFSTVHGAIETGWRAAQEIIDDCN